MPSKNYLRGYQAEKRAMALVEGMGFVAWRAHASKGPFDIYATNGEVVLLIQTKRTKKRIVSVRAVRSAFQTDLEGDGEKKLGIMNIPVPRNVHKQIWLWSDPCCRGLLKGWRFYEVFDTRGLQQIEQPYSAPLLKDPLWGWGHVSTLRHQGRWGVDDDGEIYVRKEAPARPPQDMPPDTPDQFASANSLYKRAGH